MSETRDWKAVPVYHQSGSYARMTGDLDVYRASAQANQACKEAIEQIIRENFDGMRLPRGLAERIIDQFGPDRVSWMLANTIRQKMHDGRFGLDNKNWALNVPVQPNMAMGHDQNVYLTIETHPAVLDGFIRHARAAMETRAEPSLQEQLQKAKAAPAVSGVSSEKPRYPTAKRSMPEH